jgi:ubiquinone/menaquinone biosynthesis C-methylase UbiE
MASEPKPDADRIREQQRQQWDGAASGWQEWSDTIDTGASAVSERMVELAGIGPGGRVLDVAAGYGEPSLTAAGRAGPDGSVVATDISAEMLALGRERAADAGLDNIEFVQADAASLAFADSSFDAAVSRFGIIFEPDPDAAAAAIRRLLKPGGRLSISSWGRPERVPFIAIPMQTAIRHLGVAPPPPGAPGPFARPTPEALKRLLEDSGFSDVEAEEKEVTLEWRSPQAFSAFARATLPPVRAMTAGQSPPAQHETWEAIAEAVRDPTSPGGTVRLSNLAWLAVGRA